MKGVIVGKEGLDAFQSNPEDRLVDTDTPLLKIALQEAGSVSYAASETNVTKDVLITHDLGYEPAYAVYAEVSPSSGVFRIINSSQTTLSSDVLFCITAVNNETVLIRFTDRGSVAPTGTYRYLLQVYYDEAFRG